MTEMTVREVASILGTPERTIRYRLRRGLMAGRQIGDGLWLIRPREVERWKQMSGARRGPMPRGKTSRQKSAR